MKQPMLILRKRRKELGLTLEDVGNAVGVSKGTVSKWENGNIKNMRTDKTALLAKILRLPVEDIIPNELFSFSNEGCEADSDEECDFIHPEDRRKNRQVFSDGHDNDKNIIMYHLGGKLVYDEFSDEDFDYILRTLEMLKSKAQYKQPPENK